MPCNLSYSRMQTIMFTKFMVRLYSERGCRTVMLVRDRLNLLGFSMQNNPKVLVACFTVDTNKTQGIPHLLVIIFALVIQKLFYVK